MIKELYIDYDKFDEIYFGNSFTVPGIPVHCVSGEMYTLMKNTGIIGILKDVTFEESSE